MKPTVLFLPSGRKGEFEAGTTVLEAARELGLSVTSSCGGSHTCGKCRILVRSDSSGALDPHEENLSPFSSEESGFITPEEQKSGTRLACCASFRAGHTVVFVPQEAVKMIRKEVRTVAVPLDPAVKAYEVTLSPPSLTDPRGDLERLREALQKQYGLGGLTIDARALQLLPRRLRENNWQGKAYVWMDREVLDFRARQTEIFGIALDIGTTTIAAYLCNLSDGRIVTSESVANPQAPYGEDVISRLHYTILHPGEGLKKLQQKVTAGINDLICSTATAAKITPEDILEMTVVGNTAMHHIFLGLPSEGLASSPFSPVVHQSLDIKARDLHLKMHPSANVHVLPIEAGFVGADNVGALIAQTPYDREEMTLLIDVGTNGELVLGNRRRLLSSACATGPALEGAHLRFGIPAGPGAIERVRIDPQSFGVRYKVIGSEKWSDECRPEEIRARGICGSGIIDIVAEMVKAGIINRSGNMKEGLASDRLRRGRQGLEFVIARASETAGGTEITVSVPDIRAVQLAKAALYAGAKVMMKVMGVERLDRVILAGAFGSAIDPQRAMLLGMFPDCAPEQICAVGNAAGEGACMALLNRAKRDEADWVARTVEYIELTTAPTFTDEFIAALAIPHEKDAYPHLQTHL